MKITICTSVKTDNNIYENNVSLFVSRNIEIIDSGSIEKVNEVWKKKQKIREDKNLLKQDKNFFRDIYMDGECYIIKNDANNILGFAIVTQNQRFKNSSYLAVIGVDSDYQRLGIGSELINKIKNKFGNVVCHVRKSNKNALDFYKSHDFIILKCIPSYYKNNENAYILKYEN